MNEKDIIQLLYKEFCQALIDADEDTLRRFIHRDCSVTPLTGIRQSAETFITSVISGADSYFSAEHKSIDLRIIGNAAWVIGKTQMSAALFGGERRDWNLTMKITLRESAGNWQITEIRFSTFENA